MKTAPAGSSRPRTLNRLNWSKYCQETQLLPMGLLRWLSSWFVVSEETFKVKVILDLAIHSSCLKALHDRGCLRLKQVLSGEFKATSPPSPPDFLPHPSLAGAWGECFHWPNITRIWHDKLTADMTSALTLPRFFSTLPPPRDWHGGPFPNHGELAQGLSLTMRPTRTASPPFSYSHRSDQKLAGFEVCFQKFG